MDQEKKIDNHLIIMRLDQKFLPRLLYLLPKEEIHILKKPNSGLLMMTARDSLETEFYLGEILVTEVEVEYAGQRGYAMVIRDEPERSLIAASVEAILRSDHEDLKKKIIKFLSLLRRKLLVEDKKERTLVTKTRVNFETMVKG